MGFTFICFDAVASLYIAFSSSSSRLCNSICCRIISIICCIIMEFAAIVFGSTAMAAGAAAICGWAAAGAACG